METRRQARLSRSYPANLAPARRRASPSGACSGRAVARPAPAVPGSVYSHAAAHCMIPPPRSGMVLAAGLGTRLRPVTETIPKPLIEINGRSLLNHAIDRLALVGVERVVVNVHYKAAMVAAQLARRDHPHIEISHERELLDTGGGVACALPLLGDVFFVVNSDVFWLDGKDRALQRLAAAFDPERMDAILLLQRTVTAVGYEGGGDYLLDASGCPHRRTEREVAP